MTTPTPEFVSVSRRRAWHSDAVALADSMPSRAPRVARLILRIGIALVGAIGCVAAVSAFAEVIEKPTFTNATVHDPSVVRDGANFYVFGSHLASASTPDLMNWTQISTSVANGNALVPSPFVVFKDALTWAQTTDLWAPDVIKLADGKYRFYYCACKGDSPLSALGIAIADSITGPYTNVGIILKSGMAGLSPDGTVYNNAVHPNVIDPSVFFDKTGRLWMVYGSYSGGIFIMELNPVDGKPLDGQGYGKKLIGGNNTTIEGAYILYSPESDYYYLFMTYGGLDSTGGYNIRMGRSRNPNGPYVDAAGNDLTNVKGAFGTYFDNTSIAPYGVKLMGNCQFLHVTGDAGTASTGYVSPGGTSAYYDKDTGKYLMVFHTRFVGRGEVHEIRVHQLYLNDEGWLVASPHRYAHETIGATDPSQIPGSFKLINHGKAVSATVNTSVVIALNSDHTISGAVTGTWALSGNHFATLTLGGVTYHGVFSRQWDNDNQVWVWTFSAVSDDGVCVWGSKVTGASVSAIPTITTQPTGRSLIAGQSMVLKVGASGTPEPNYQWYKDGVSIANATNNFYPITRSSAADAGSYTVVVKNSVGAVTSSEAVVGVDPVPAQVAVDNGVLTSHIVNLSTRGIVSTGDNVLIAGFVISGSASKQLLILGSGLNLTKFGVTGEIGRPHLTLYHRVNQTNVVVAENSDWQANAAAITPLVTQVGAQTFGTSTDPAHGDAGMVATLDPGIYTVVVSPDAASANQDGIGLIELYDTTPADGSRLVNLSTRGRIETGARQMIVGVVVGGQGSDRLLIRAVGPALKDYGIARALMDPSQTVYWMHDNTKSVVGSNDDWWASAQADQAATLFASVGAFSLAAYSSDSNILQLTAPGVYTTVISPSDDTPGVALAEIYEANSP